MDVSKQKRLKQSSKLERIRFHAAGADLGATEHYVAVEEDLVNPGELSLRSFATHSAGLAQLVDWLRGLGITTIAMEATGVYWMGIYEALEQEGIEVCLVNARHLKNVAGRKTDPIDARWIQTLHSYGLLRPSFVPEQIFRDLRSYVRQRDNLKGEKSRAMMHIHKAFDMMNVKVHHHLKNMDTPTGMKILRAIVGGQTDSQILSKFHSKHLKVSQEELEISLRGNYRAAHVFGLSQALERYDFVAQQMKTCELEVEKLLALMSDGLAELPPQNQPLRAPKRKVQKNEYHFDLKSYLQELAGVDLTAVDGLRASTVLDIISETGLDLKAYWPTHQHFVSWALLAPKVKISGGKKIGHFKVKSVNRVHQAFRLAAFGLANSKSGLGAFYRSVRARRGTKVANKATARKIAVIFYHMITKKEEYRRTSQQDYDQRNEARRIRRLKKQALQLGFELKKVA